MLLRQTTESADRRRVLDLGSENTLVDLGTYHDILHGQDESGRLELQLSWRGPDSYAVQDPVRRARKVRSTLLTSDEYSVSATIEIDRNQAEVVELVYGLGDASFTMSRRSDGGGYDLASTDYDFVRSAGRAWPLPAPSRFYGFPDQVRSYFQNTQFLSDLELRFEQQCERLRYLGPLREDPKRQYIYSGGAPSDVGKRGELAIDALIASEVQEKRLARGWRVGPKRRTRLPQISMETLIAQWLKELGLISSFTLESLDDRETLYRVKVSRTPSSPPVLITDVGFGVSQVLPVLVLLAYSSSGDTVLLEQPEIHLHPAVQSKLADLVIETALARGVQVIVETHSEHFLTRLQRRIAERDFGNGIELETDDVALYFANLCEIAVR